MARRKKIKVVLKPIPRAWGLAWEEDKEIHLDPRMDDRTMLHIASHEVLHVLFPFMTEAAVDEAGIQLGDVLWALGFKRDEP